MFKLCGDSIAHKTERNLVRLDLATADQVAAAGRDLLAATTDDDGPTELLVPPMVRSNRELIIGAQRSEQFGPVVAALGSSTTSHQLLPTTHCPDGGRRIFGRDM